jgi:hypothetical protein
VFLLVSLLFASFFEVLRILLRRGLKGSSRNRFFYPVEHPFVFFEFSCKICSTDCRAVEAFNSIFASRLSSFHPFSLFVVPKCYNIYVGRAHRIGTGLYHGYYQGYLRHCDSPYSLPYRPRYCPSRLSVISLAA